MPNLSWKWYVHEKILSCLYIATQEFTWKKKWIFKQSAAPTLATLAGAANGLRPLAARWLAGIIVVFCPWKHKKRASKIAHNWPQTVFHSTAWLPKPGINLFSYYKYSSVSFSGFQRYNLQSYILKKRKIIFSRTLILEKRLLRKHSQFTYVPSVSGIRRRTFGRNLPRTRNISQLLLLFFVRR